MEEKKINKKDIILKVTGGVLIAVVSFKLGKKFEGIRLNNMLDNLARTGKVITNYVDGKEYELSITEIK